MKGQATGPFNSTVDQTEITGSLKKRLHLSWCLAYSCVLRPLQILSPFAGLLIFAYAGKYALMASMTVSDAGKFIFTSVFNALTTFFLWVSLDLLRIVGLVIGLGFVFLLSLICLYASFYNCYPWIQCPGCGEINTKPAGCFLEKSYPLYHPEPCRKCQRDLKDLSPGIWQYLLG